MLPSHVYDIFYLKNVPVDDCRNENGAQALGLHEQLVEPGPGDGRAPDGMIHRSLHLTRDSI